MSEFCTYLQAGSVPATMDRLVTDILMRGNTGVCGGAELKVLPSASDLSVNVNPGRCVIPAGVLVSGIPVEGAYVYANTAIKNIVLTTADSVKYRTDLIVARIYDNVLFADGSSEGVAELLTGEVSAVNPAPAPVPGYLRYHILAQVRVNPLATVPTLVVDQRALANARTQELTLVTNGGATNDTTAVNPTFGDWPATCQWTVPRPLWATMAEFTLYLFGVYGITSGPTQTNLRVNCDGQTHVVLQQFSFTVDELNIRKYTYVLFDQILAVPQNPTNLWKVQSARVAGAGGLRWDNNNWGRLKVKYIEGLK